MPATNAATLSIPSQTDSTPTSTSLIALTTFSSNRPQPSPPTDGPPPNAAAGAPPPNAMAMTKRIYSGSFRVLRKATKWAALAAWALSMNRIVSILVLCALMFTCFYDGKRSLDMAATDDDVVWNWPLLSCWAVETTWYVVSHCIRLHWASMYADTSSNPLPPATYLTLVLVWSILHLLLHPFYTQAETPAHAHNLFILYTPPTITVGILLFSASRFSQRSPTRPGDLENQIGNTPTNSGQTSGASPGTNGILENSSSTNSSTSSGIGGMSN